MSKCYLNYEKDIGGGYEAGMIVGGFHYYLALMIDHHLERGRLLVGNIMVLDSYDGAVHTPTNTKESCIVSYNSPVFHSSFSEYNITTATSSNILTWMQSITDESRATNFPIMMAIYEQQKILRVASTTTLAGCTFSCYQVHDAKLIYFLTQHEQWSRNEKLFLLCKCDKGKGATNKDNIYSFVTDTEQVCCTTKQKPSGTKTKLIPNI